MDLKNRPSQSKKVSSAISGKMKKAGAMNKGVDLAAIAQKVAKRKMSGKGKEMMKKMGYMDGMGGMGKKTC